MSLKSDILSRFAVVYLFMLVFSVVIVYKVVAMQLGQGDQYAEKALDMVQKNIIIEPNRGDIVAQDGRILASSVPYYDIHMDLVCPGLTDEVFNAKVDSLALCLSKEFGDKSKDAYLQKLIKARSRGDRYLSIQKNVNYNQLKRMKQFPIFRRGQFEGGLISEKQNMRIRPFGELARRTVGYISKDENAQDVGLEAAYNGYLRGKQGVRLMQRVPGNVWMPVHDQNEVEPQDGFDVITTIDISVQDVAHSALERQLIRHEAAFGTAILMEVRTGHVKAIVNLQRTENGNYYELYNHAIGTLVEPGSTFKLASMLAAFEDGYIDLDDSVETGRGVVSYFGQKMRDSHVGGFGKISVQDVFAYSSNVGVSKLIYDHYRGKEERFVQRLYNMHLNQKLDIEIEGEATPYIKHPSDSTWWGTTLPWMSIGYEVMLTPMQILAFYNAIANGGRMVKPMFVKELRFHGEVVQEFDPQVLSNSVCSFSTARKARKMLEAVVDYGTGVKLKSPNYAIAGKTGTTQLDYYKRGSKANHQASFVGYFPAEDPRYSCIVLVSRPQKDKYYASEIALPVFREIADKVYATSLQMHSPVNAGGVPLKEVPYSKNGYKPHLEYIYKYTGVDMSNYYKVIASDWVFTQKRDEDVSFSNLPVRRGIVPDVRGMGARDAVFLLENLGLKVVISGRGSVKNQSIEAGHAYQAGQAIKLKLS